MKCYSLLLGARNTPAATARFSAKDEARIRTITFRHFPEGFTILNADGGWFDPLKKTFVKEQSRQILICTSQPRKLAAWCGELAAALKQDELLVVELGRAATFTDLLNRKGLDSGNWRKAVRRPGHPQRV